MATVDSDKVVCGGIHAMAVAVLVLLGAHSTGAAFIAICFKYQDMGSFTKFCIGIIRRHCLLIICRYYTSKDIYNRTQ
jgi:hypothetical protein